MRCDGYVHYSCADVGYLFADSDPCKRCIESDEVVTVSSYHTSRSSRHTSRSSSSSKRRSYTVSENSMIPRNISDCYVRSRKILGCSSLPPKQHTSHKRVTVTHVRQSPVIYKLLQPNRSK